jgi:hypothetical protein
MATGDYKHSMAWQSYTPTTDPDNGQRVDAWTPGGSLWCAVDAQGTIRIAVNKAAVPVKSAVVAAAPADVGNLKKSIRIKVKYYAKSKTWAAIIGPSSTFKRVRKKPKKIKPKKPNKTLQSVKKRLSSLKQLAGRKLSQTVRNAAGRRQSVRGKAGRRLANAIKDFTAKPKPMKQKKVKRRKRAWNGKPVRPARYAHLMEWGSRKLSARKFLTKALSRSRGRFSSLLSSSLRAELG